MIGPRGFRRLLIIRKCNPLQSRGVCQRPEARQTDRRALLGHFCLETDVLVRKEEREKERKREEERRERAREREREREAQVLFFLVLWGGVNSERVPDTRFHCSCIILACIFFLFAYSLSLFLLLSLPLSLSLSPTLTLSLYFSLPLFLLLSLPLSL